MQLSRRRFLQTGAAAVGAAAVTGPLAQRARGGDWWYPFGIDVSHWQGTINWNAVANYGTAFAFMKATEGTTYRDPQFQRNWSEAARVGIYRGAYHFGRPGTSAVTQARHFINTTGSWSGSLIGVLDIEVTDGRTPAQVWTWVQAFVNEVRRLTGVPPIIYTSPSFWTSRVGNPTNNLGCSLWIAHWGVSWPTYPRAWASDGPSFWQTSSTGRVPGISGNVDEDVFMGPYSWIPYWVYG